MMLCVTYIHFNVNSHSKLTTDSQQLHSAQHTVTKISIMLQSFPSSHMIILIGFRYCVLLPNDSNDPLYMNPNTGELS